MRCVTCGTELIPGKQFCHACGRSAPRHCASCGAVLEPGFRFCPECGTSVDDHAAAPSGADRLARLSCEIPTGLAEKIRASPRAIAGERKLVTVLFCDLVGSTAIAERLDPEDYRDVLERYMQVALREIYRVEGIVTQLAGDGFMALFGAPVAHEDAPHRAVHAALAIRAALDALSTDLRAKDGPELQVRIGIHTGPVVVGTVGTDLKMDYTAVGDTTNLAARLQALAEPGMILVSEATSRLVRGFFDLRAWRRLEVKGKAEPVAAYEIRGARAATTPMAVAEARGLTPLVGRDQELAQLAACYERLAGHLAQVVAIVGPAGSGKSRLLYEFAQRLAGSSHVLFEARCSAMVQSVPYTPWIAMLRQHFALAPEDEAAAVCLKVRQRIGDALGELEAAVPPLCRLVAPRGDAGPSSEVPEDERKRQTFEAVAQLVHVTSQRTPVVMIIEDLHWIDEASREMLELAVEHVHRGRFMLLVSHRPDYQPAWRVTAAFTQLTLGPLSDEDTTAIIRAVAGGPLPPELDQRIRQQAEGNPFFTEEITRALAEEGYLLRSDGHVRLTRPVAEMRLPGTVEEVIGARLDRLAPHAKRVVQVAAVLGRQFRRQQLAAILAGEGIDVAAELALLERRGIVHRKTLLSDDELRFGESLTQEVAYQGLLLRQRRELHERIGHLLESLPGEPTAERAALLAHHFVRSENRDRAVAALIHAAQDAERLPSFRAAARFYRQAWELAEPLLAGAEPPAAAQRLVLQAAFGVSRMAVIYGVVEGDVEDVLERGRGLAEALDDDEALAQLCALHGMAMSSQGRERFAAGQALVEEGLAVAERAGLVRATIGIARALAWGYFFDGRLDDAERKNEWALAELARLDPPGRPSDLQLSMRFMGDRMHYYRDDLAGAFRRAAATYEIALGVANRTVQLASSATLAQVHLARAEYAEARRWADRSLEIAQRIGNMAQVRTASAVGLLASRELADTGAQARYLGLLEAGIALGPEPLTMQLIVEALLAVGQARRAEDVARTAYETSGGRLRETLCLAALGDVLLRLGPTRAAEARQCYEHARALAEALGARISRARTLLGLGELAAGEGDGAAAQRHFTEALEVFRTLGYLRDHARTERLLASLETRVQESA